MSDQWPDVRLNDRFEVLDRDIADLRRKAREYGPVVGQVSEIVGSIDALEADVAMLKRSSDEREQEHSAALKKRDEEYTAFLRDGRAETSKQLAWVFGVLVLAVLGVVVTGGPP